MAILKIKDENGNIIEVPALKGDKGVKGDKGYTPVKGTDYWTEADKAEIKDYVNQQISNSGSSHTHDNKNVLDTITADKVNEWSEFTSGGATATDIDAVYDDTDGVYTFYGSDLEAYPYDTNGAVLQFKVDGYVNQFLFRMDGTIVMRAKIDGTWGEWKDVSSNKVTEDAMKDYVNQQLGVIENGAY